MSRIPYIPETAPFTDAQRQWLNGFLAGLFSAGVPESLLAGGPLPALPEGNAAPARLPLTLLFGTQTGTAEALARKIAAQAKSFVPRVLDMAQHAEIDWSQEERLLIITSTYGDGEMPDNAQPFWSFLSSDAAPRLERLAFSVLALGDTNYAAFCQAGKDFDARLEALGARRVHPRTDCDVDYDAAAKAWAAGALQALNAGAATDNAAPSVNILEGADSATESGPVFSRTNPFPAQLLAGRVLTGAGSEKETRHFEISLEGSPLTYEVGDALGVVPANCPQLVDDLLATLGADGEEAVVGAAGEEVSFRKALTEQFEITKITPDALRAIAERTGNAEWLRLLDPANKEDLRKFTWGRELIDLLPGCHFAPAEFIALLKKLPARLYSISSSPKAHPGQVHLTVSVVRYVSHGRARKGVCSTFLADRTANGCPVPVYVQKSHGFRLPANGETPIIMVGPGTGIAPFRAFLEERRATNSKGRNWLFFGDQREASDFLYRDELTAWENDGFLKLTTAFSRDQAQKIYVQHRMEESAAELWAWLQEGAHFYVCGDASRMAKDVDLALHKAAENAGGLSPEAAAAYVAKLKADKRYQRDVY